MAFDLIKEDGTGKADANVYASLDDAKAYLERTGRKDTAQWDEAETSAKKAALVNATQYMDTAFRKRYLGTRASATADTQALEFPRDGLYAPSGGLIDSASIPVEVVNACVEYAYASLAGELTPDSTGRTIKRQRRKVGPIETETEFDGSSFAANMRTFPRAYRILQRWLRVSGHRVIR